MNRGRKAEIGVSLLVLTSALILSSGCWLVEEVEEERYWGFSEPKLAVSMAAGEGVSCAVMEDGSVSCWGKNHYGGLGNGSFSHSKVPIPKY